MRGIGRAGLCAVALAALVATAGCGSDDGDGSKTAGASNTQRPKQGFSGSTDRKTKGRSAEPGCEFEQVSITVLHTGLRPPIQGRSGVIPELNCGIIKGLLDDAFQLDRCVPSNPLSRGGEIDSRNVEWENEVDRDAGGKPVACTWITEKRGSEFDQFIAFPE